MISSSVNPPAPTPTETTEVSPANRLQAMEKGYLKVLSREPNNITALEGLVNVKLEQGDQKGAIGYLEKLVQLYPDNPSYKAVLGQLKQAPNQPNQPVNQPK
jgi:predicted Zn-dependent protease